MSRCLSAVVGGVGNVWGDKTGTKEIMMTDTPLCCDLPATDEPVLDSFLFAAGAAVTVVGSFVGFHALVEALKGKDRKEERGR